MHWRTEWRRGHSLFFRTGACRLPDTLLLFAAEFRKPQVPPVRRKQKRSGADRNLIEMSDHSYSFYLTAIVTRLLWFDPPIRARTETLFPSKPSAGSLIFNCQTPTKPGARPEY